MYLLLCHTACYRLPPRANVFDNVKNSNPLACLSLPRLQRRKYAHSLDHEGQVSDSAPCSIIAWWNLRFQAVQYSDSAPCSMAAWWNLRLAVQYCTARNLRSSTRELRDFRATRSMPHQIPVRQTEFVYEFDFSSITLRTLFLARQNPSQRSRILDIQTRAKSLLGVFAGFQSCGTIAQPSIARARGSSQCRRRRCRYRRRRSGRTLAQQTAAEQIVIVGLLLRVRNEIYFIDRLLLLHFLGTRIPIRCNLCSRTAARPTARAACLRRHILRQILLPSVICARSRRLESRRRSRIRLPTCSLWKQGGPGGVCCACWLACGSWQWSDLKSFAFMPLCTELIFRSKSGPRYVSGRRKRPARKIRATDTKIAWRVGEQEA